jgi:hypothetical protein
MKHLCWIVLAACGHHEVAQLPPPEYDPAPIGVAQIQLTSQSFDAKSAIPSDHTCDGADRSPALAWGGIDPNLARSYALIVDDPDAPDPKAPKKTWVHWVVIDLPASTLSLPAGAATSLPTGAANGKNDFGKLTWNGPCPPVGNHRYVFKIYALDTVIGKPGITKAELLQAMKNHVTGKGELVGMYQKQK